MPLIFLMSITGPWLIFQGNSLKLVVFKLSMLEASRCYMHFSPDLKVYLNVPTPRSQPSQHITLDHPLDRLDFQQTYLTKPKMM